MNQSSRDVPGKTGQGQAGREKDREGVRGLAKAARNTALTMRRKRSAAGWLILGGSAKRPSGLAKAIPVLPVGDAQASRDHPAVWKLSVPDAGRRTAGWYCFGRDSRCSAPGPRQSGLRGAASLSESVNCFAVKSVNV
ncbi:hypothetical protein [Kyrpidia tusciae]|uniref:Uncharacterized protein n=1 Tax=Kyrpidia tusciae (strain DSM 2912 / NBRC 15312 / T2) TaxID=562970 RepID=D5WWT5_KYRT2|nr:hypothetical protein [Kyrpidia tusciae]ADG05786.1 hypothetical protein Btus_1048 [Kyrpidia tusciae DSM 2912]